MDCGWSGGNVCVCVCGGGGGEGGYTMSGWWFLICLAVVRRPNYHVHACEHACVRAGRRIVIWASRWCISLSDHQINEYLLCSIPVPYLSGAELLHHANVAGALAGALGALGVGTALANEIGGVASTCASLPLSNTALYFMVGIVCRANVFNHKCNSLHSCLRQCVVVIVFS